jgi:hypothetical protein
MSGRTSRDPSGAERKAQSLAIAKLAELRQARLERAALVPFADQTNCSSSCNESDLNVLDGATRKFSEPASLESRRGQRVLEEPLQQVSIDTEGREFSVDFRRLRKGIKSHDDGGKGYLPEEHDVAKIAASQACQKLLQSGGHGDDEQTMSKLLNNFGSLSLDHAQKAVPTDTKMTFRTGLPHFNGQEAKENTLQTDWNLQGKQHSFNLPGSVAASLYDHQVGWFRSCCRCLSFMPYSVVSFDLQDDPSVSKSESETPAQRRNDPDHRPHLFVAGHRCKVALEAF